MNIFNRIKWFVFFILAYYPILPTALLLHSTKANPTWYLMRDNYIEKSRNKSTKVTFTLRIDQPIRKPFSNTESITNGNFRIRGGGFLPKGENQKMIRLTHFDKNQNRFTIKQAYQRKSLKLDQKTVSALGYNQPQTQFIIASKFNKNGPYNQTNLKSLPSSPFELMDKKSKRFIRKLGDQYGLILTEANALVEIVQDPQFKQEVKKLIKDQFPSYKEPIIENSLKTGENGFLIGAKTAKDSVNLKSEQLSDYEYIQRLFKLRQIQEKNPEAPKYCPIKKTTVDTNSWNLEKNLKNYAKDLLPKSYSDYYVKHCFSLNDKLPNNYEMVKEILNGPYVQILMNHIKTNMKPNKTQMYLSQEFEHIWPKQMSKFETFIYRQTSVDKLEGITFPTVGGLFDRKENCIFYPKIHHLEKTSDNYINFKGLSESAKKTLDRFINSDEYKNLLNNTLKSNSYSPKN